MRCYWLSGREVLARGRHCRGDDELTHHSFNPARTAYGTPCCKIVDLREEALVLQPPSARTYARLTTIEVRGNQYVWCSDGGGRGDGRSDVGGYGGTGRGVAVPLTQVEVYYLNSVRGNFAGDDDQLLLAGKQACRLLYTGQSAPAVIGSTAGQYGASPDQAAGLVSAARGTMCTQAPG